MRNNVKRLVSTLLVVALVFALSITTFATGEKSLLTLTGTTGAVMGGEVTVTVDAAKGGVVADGKLTFTYDSAKLRFVGAEAGAAWPENADLSLQVNGSKQDTVIIAFAGVQAAEAGTVLSLNFTALDEGQSTVSLDQENSYVTDAEDYTLAAEATVEVTCYASQFTDVNLSRYYHTGIDFVMANGLMQGIGGNLFAPELGADRAMLVTILYRMEGQPQVTGEMPFADVAEERYYYDAILWASQNGIAKGMTETLFAPSKPVTREQMVTFFARYAAQNGISLEAESDLSKFVDGSKVSNFAKESMIWAVEVGLIYGMENSTLQPKGTSTRGQLATVIERYAMTIANCERQVLKYEE